MGCHAWLGCGEEFSFNLQPIFFNFMGRLRRYQQQLSKVTIVGQTSDLLKIVRDSSNAIIDANLDQLQHGLEATGKPIDPPYASKYYADFKLSLNPRGVVDLKLTGAFYEGFFLKASKFPVTISSKDKKTKALKAKYGDEIFGLTSDSKKGVIEGYLSDDIKSYYRSLLRVR